MRRPGPRFGKRPLWGPKYQLNPCLAGMAGIVPGTGSDELRPGAAVPGVAAFDRRHSPRGCGGAIPTIEIAAQHFLPAVFGKTACGGRSISRP